MKKTETFAFRLAKRDNSLKAQWKARPDGAVAGCTMHLGDFHFSDANVFC